MENLIAKLKQDTQCFLCNDTLIEPKILPCFHTFCKQCIKRHAELIEEVNVFKCPECKTETSLPEEDSVEDLKPSTLHFRFSKVLEFVEKEKVCSVSGSHSPASWHCLNCNRSLCDECQTNHSLFTNDHKVVSLSELDSKDVEFMLARESNCQDHTDNLLSLICQECNTAICFECSKQNHHEHEIILLEKFVTSKKAFLSEEVQKLKNNEESLQHQVNLLETIASDTKDNCENVKAKVKETTAKMIQKLQEDEQSLLQKIEENITLTETNKMKGKNLLAKSRRTTEYINKMKNEGLGSEIIAMEDTTSLTASLFNTSIPVERVPAIAFVPSKETIEFELNNAGLGDIQIRDQTDHVMSIIDIECEVEALKRASLTVLTKTSKGDLNDNPNDVIDVKIYPEENVRTEERSVIRIGAKTVSEFTPLVAGSLTAEVQVNGKHVSNSPLLISAKPQEMKIAKEFNMITKGIDLTSPVLAGIAVNKQNSRVAVVHEFSHCVSVFNFNGEVLLTYGSRGSAPRQLYSPRSLAFLTDADLIIVDRGNHRISIVNTNTGTLVKSFGNQGNGNGEFDYPLSVHVDDDGNIIVCDRDNHRVQVFTRNGDYQYQFGLTTQDNFDPVSTVTHGGRFYVSDRSNHVIHVFEKKDGVPTRVSTIGERGSDDGQLNTPCGLAIDNDHHLLVCDHGNNRIQKFTLDGRFIGSLNNGIKNPSDIAALEDGRVMIVQDRLKVFIVQ